MTGPDTFADRLVNSTIATLETRSVHLGDRLGLYDALRHEGPLARFAAGTSAVLPQLLHAYRTGGGVPWQAAAARLSRRASALFT